MYNTNNGLAASTIGSYLFISYLLKASQSTCSDLGRDTILNLAI